MAEVNKEKWIRRTRDFAAVMKEAADRVDAGEHIDDVLCMSVGGITARKLGSEFPGWCFDAVTYTIKPKRTIRPWTAKEWGARIGDWFAESTGQRWQLVKVMDGGALEFKNEPYVNGIRTMLLSGVGTESFTNLDGSPCGVFEEVKG